MDCWHSGNLELYDMTLERSLSKQVFHMAKHTKTALLGLEIMYTWSSNSRQNRHTDVYSAS